MNPKIEKPTWRGKKKKSIGIEPHRSLDWEENPLYVRCAEFLTCVIYFYEILF